MEWARSPPPGPARSHFCIRSILECYFSDCESCFQPTAVSSTVIGNNYEMQCWSAATCYLATMASYKAADHLVVRSPLSRLWLSIVRQLLLFPSMLFHGRAWPHQVVLGNKNTLQCVRRCQIKKDDRIERRIQGPWAGSSWLLRTWPGPSAAQHDESRRRWPFLDLPLLLRQFWLVRPNIGLSHSYDACELPSEALWDIQKWDQAPRSREGWWGFKWLISGMGGRLDQKPTNAGYVCVCCLRWFCAMVSCLSFWRKTGWCLTLIIEEWVIFRPAN